MASTYEEFIIERMTDHGQPTGCEIVLVFRECEDQDDGSKAVLRGWGETVYCKTDHAHSRACAVTLASSLKVREALEARRAIVDAVPKPVEVSIGDKEIK